MKTISRHSVMSVRRAFLHAALPVLAFSFFFVPGSKENPRQSHALDRLGHDRWFECTDVGGDIRQFWYAYQLAGRTRTFATSLF